MALRGNEVGLATRAVKGRGEPRRKPRIPFLACMDKECRTSKIQFWAKSIWGGHFFLAHFGGTNLVENVNCRRPNVFEQTGLRPAVRIPAWASAMRLASRCTAPPSPPRSFDSVLVQLPWVTMRRTSSRATPTPSSAHVAALSSALAVSPRFWAIGGNDGNRWWPLAVPPSREVAVGVGEENAASKAPPREAPPFAARAAAPTAAERRATPTEETLMAPTSPSTRSVLVASSSSLCTMRSTASQ